MLVLNTKYDLSKHKFQSKLIDSFTNRSEIEKISEKISSMAGLRLIPQPIEKSKLLAMMNKAIDIENCEDMKEKLEGLRELRQEINPDSVSFSDSVSISNPDDAIKRLSDSIPTTTALERRYKAVEAGILHGDLNKLKKRINRENKLRNEFRQKMQKNRVNVQETKNCV